MRIKDVMSGLWGRLRPYFSIGADMESQADIEASIRQGVSFRGSQLVVLVMAIFTASLGLNTDSIPVIIGAMLISPLMGPIIGMGLGIGIHDYGLLKRGLKNIVLAVLGSLAASAVYFLISPQYEGSSQLLARTSPTIYDVFIALFGGGAGIVSIACRNKGQVLPGVAIATSLMPPLCTAGYGLATCQMSYFLGAMYLFFTNMVFIMVATWIGVKVMGLRAVVQPDERRARRVQAVVGVVVTCMVLVSGWLTVQMVRKSIFLNAADEFVRREMVWPNTQVLSHSEGVTAGRRWIDVTLIGTPLPKDSLVAALTARLDSAGLGGTVLNIRQGVAVDLADRGGKVAGGESLGQVYALMEGEISARQVRIDSLESVLALRGGLSDAAPRVAAEVRVLWPGVREIALGSMLAADVAGGGGTDTLNVAFVWARRGLSARERDEMARWLEVRLKCDDVRVMNMK